MYWGNLHGIHTDKKVPRIKEYVMKIAVLILLFSTSALAYVDFNLSYTASLRRVDGVKTITNPNPGGAQTSTTGYLFNWAWFMWEYTAIELNYSSTVQRLVDDREMATASESITIKKQDSSVVTQVSGIGIRQAFANRKSTIIPSIAIGYAQYTTSGSTKYTLDASGIGEVVIEEEQDKEVFSSSYASFSLRFRFTQLMGLTLAAKTVMPDFESDQASNNMTYSAGFSWVF